MDELKEFNETNNHNYIKCVETNALFFCTVDPVYLSFMIEKYRVDYPQFTFEPVRITTTINCFDGYLFPFGN